MLDDFSLDIGTGEKCVIRGKSGSGKSSLFGMVLGFVRPERGRVFFNETEVDSRTVWAVRKQVAFVDQDVSLGDKNVEEWLDIVFGLNANRQTRPDHAKIMQLFDYFELSSDTIEKSISDLSGGERQRIALIVSLLLQRPCLLLDEVTSALDDLLKQKVVDYLCRDPDLTVVVISHDSVWMHNSRFRVFDMDTGK